MSEDRFIEHFASFISGIWQIHPFREGNTRTVAVFAIKYLRAKGFKVENDLFKDKSFYFRNALVRANYENTANGVEKTTLPLEEFFKVLVYGYEIELHNRFLRIGQEYGTSAAEKIANLHRRDVSATGVETETSRKQKTSRKKTGSKNKTSTKDAILDAIRKNPNITREELRRELNGLTLSAINWQMADLKKKGLIRRVGGRKCGSWEIVETVAVKI